MRKTFPLELPNHKPPRVIELIKRDVRKYVKRERRKPLPEDVDFWDFDCRVGVTEAEAASVHIEEVTKAIDAAAEKSENSIYVELLAKPGRRMKRPKPDSSGI